MNVKPAVTRAEAKMVAEAFATLYAVKVEQVMRGRNCHPDVRRARWGAMVDLYQRGYSQSSIARAFGLADHSTVSYAVKMAMKVRP